MIKTGALVFGTVSRTRLCTIADDMRQRVTWHQPGGINNFVAAGGFSPLKIVLILLRVRERCV